MDEPTDAGGPIIEPAGTRPDGLRSGYHHGALRSALVDAALALAREGGPEAVALREVARRTGVSATAAYRHFADHADLIHAVKEQALLELLAAMQAELDAVAPGADPTEAALARLRAIGLGYIRFAIAEPGLFRLAFDRRDAAKAYTGQWRHATYQLLSGVLDELVAAGRIDPGRRAYAEIAVWSAVHGLAMLLVDGLLVGMPADEREVATRRVIDMVLRGI